VLMGGAVQGLLTNRSRNVAGVSLFAAHMPGTSQKDLVPPDLPVPHTSMSCSDVIQAFGLIHFVHILSLPQSAGMHARSGEQQHVVPEVPVHMSIVGRCIVLMPVSVLPVQLRPKSSLPQ